MIRTNAPAAPVPAMPEALRPPYGLFVAAVLGTLLVLAALLASQVLLGLQAGRIHADTLEGENLTSRIVQIDDSLAALVTNVAGNDGNAKEQYSAQRAELAASIDRLLTLVRNVCDQDVAYDMRRDYQRAAEIEDQAFHASQSGDSQQVFRLLGDSEFIQTHRRVRNGITGLHANLRRHLRLTYDRLRRWQTGFSAAAVIGVGIIAAAWADAFRRLRRYERRSRQAVDIVFESERRVRDLQHILRLAIDSMPQRLFWKDLNSRFLGCNEAMARDAGLDSPDGIIGLVDADLPWREKAEEYVADDRMVIESGLSRLGIEEPFADAEGGARWLRTSKVPLRDHSGQIIGVMGTFEDVTRERETKDELKRAKEEAEQASRAKSEFLANMSHEIRTPMTAILGFADLLCDPDVDVSQRSDYVGTIRKNGEHLLSLINDILDLSKIEAGHFEVEQIQCNPAQIVDDVHTLMGVRAAAKALPFEVEFATALPEFVESDPTRIRQILVNLVGNAIKFTEVGKVRMVVQCRAEEGSHLLSFDVIDTGIGMTRPQLVRLFRPFVQADASTRRMFGGTGLGLAISKRLAEMLGGGLTVFSTPRQGSTFRLSLKLRVPADARWLTPTAGESARTAKQTVSSDDQPLRGLRILLAEDGPDNRRLISHVLNRAGAELRMVENGRDAVDCALSATEIDQPYHLILMDMQMPILDGYDATKLLRARGYSHPIVALTAHAMSGDRDHCLTAGCNDYATKPIKRQELVATILKWAPQPVAIAPA